MVIDEVQLGTMLIMMWSHSTWGLMLTMDAMAIAGVCVRSLISRSFAMLTAVKFYMLAVSRVYTYHNVDGRP